MNRRPRTCTPSTLSTLRYTLSVLPALDFHCPTHSPASEWASPGTWAAPVAPRANMHATIARTVFVDSFAPGHLESGRHLRVSPGSTCRRRRASRSHHSNGSSQWIIESTRGCAEAGTLVKDHLVQAHTQGGDHAK